jgi:hypothetical protein
MPRVASDRPRYLDRDVARGITLRPDRAAHGEPEPVGESDQLAMTRAAHLVWQRRRQLAWQEARQGIDELLDTFLAAIGPGDRPVRNAVRALRRNADRLGERVASR